MSTRFGLSPTINTSAVRNSVGRGKEKSQENPNELVSDAALKEFCDKNYNQLLPILAEKMHQEKVQQEKLKAVKARLNFEEASQYSESGAPSRRGDVRKRLGPKDACSMSRSPEPRHDRSRSPRRKDPERETVFKRLEKDVFHRLGDKEKGMSAYSGSSRRQSHHNSREDTKSYYRNSCSRGTESAPKRHHDKKACSRKGGRMSESEDSAGEHWKSKSKKQRSSMEDKDLSRPWVCEETDMFTPRIRYFDLPKRIRMRSHFKTYDRSKDPEDHLKIFQAAAKVERWAMPTWYHMFNSTLTGNARVWFDDLPPESIDSYDDLKETFLANYLQQKKCIKDPRRSGSGQPGTEEDISAMEAARCRTPENFKKGGFKNQQRPEKRQDRFALLTKTSKEILALDKVKFKPPPPMKTPVEKRNASKFCEFHGEVGHTTDRCMHLKRQIEEMLKTGKLSHLIKELKQSNGKDQAKVAKKGEAARKDKPLAILMVQTGRKIAKQRITQTFSPETMISFPPLGEEDGTEGPMVIEAEVGGHLVHRLYVDGGASSEILYEHCDEEHSTSAWMNFMVVSSHSPYNGIIGRPSVRRIKSIPSTAHEMLKFPVIGGTDAEEKIQVAIHPEYPEQTIAIGSTLTKEGRKKLCGLLRQNLDIFALKPADMTGVPRHIAEHRLNVRKGCFPVRQKKRGQASERNKAICEEVEKLVNAGIMKEVHYHNWLSNPVMVKKRDNSWRMCVDFKDLNKACPKDGYPLPEIDWKVESLCGYPFKCFLDAYKGYHQIKMAKEDEEKTAFITSQGIFCYSKMPFGLKNVGATYQRLVDKAFQKQIGRNLEAYVDDLVIKSCTEQEIIRDVEETFRTLRKINMKLNPKKCTFGMKEGVFLGYKVNSDGLTVCPDKVKAVLSLPSPKCLKDCTKKSDFQWTTEAEAAFQQMKKLIAELPMMDAPQEKEELIIYLAAAKEAISAVLMTERDGKQIPIYFVSRALRGPEINYTPMEKLVLALVSASKRLKRYFQAHTVIVITDQPIKQMLSNPEVTGRLLKWSFELEEHDIQYRPRTSVKGQILADFIVERPEDNSEDTLMEDEEELPDPWTLFTDGSSCADGSGAGLILINPEGMEFTYALRFRFDATNNEAEYEALIAGLKIAEQMGVQNLQENVDSRLVANQVNGTYVAKENDMIRYLEKVKTLTGSFKVFSIKQVPRSENKKADALSKIASTSFAHLSKQVLVEELKEKSINTAKVLAVVEEEGDTWMTPIFKYLSDGTLPAEGKKARAVKRKSWRFSIINGILYKKSFLGPWLRCVGPLQANYVLREIHEGSCSMHAGTRSVVAKALWIGYYWPTMHEDSRKLIQACQDCQVHKPIPRNPQQKLSPITSPWPFYKWGIDIAGPFLKGPGKVKFLIVAIDYFTKWIEAKPVETITGSQIKKFVWDNFVSRFGLPGEIISDNGKQFQDNPFKDWCEKLCIRQHFASIKHPQTNGLVERANRSLGEGIKAKLDERRKNWMKELPHVLWAHRTMIKSSNRDTPFSLTYETEAVILAEIDMPTLRTIEINLKENKEALEINLDLLEERREQAAIREAKSKAKMERYYNSEVQSVSFKPGDLVYRNNEASSAEDTGKLGPKWEGPYEVTKALGKGAYKLRDQDKNQLLRTWNVSNLKKCYMHKM
ncbi:reverse transcriptase domain-containing protein [Tanacetum coccineum]